MQFQKLIALIYGMMIALLILNGCANSSSGSDGDSATSELLEGGIEFSSDNSDLVLIIPPGLTVRLSDVQKIYQTTASIPACQSSTAIDLVLAQACNFYHQYYLYLDKLPRTLEAIKTVTQYVNLLRLTDQYTYHLPPSSFADLNSSIEGSISTIGIDYILSGNVVSASTPFKIKKVIPLSRAWFDGLKAGDHLVAINGKRIEGWDKKTVMNKLPSTEGETVTLTVNRKGSELFIQTASEEHIGFMVGDDEDIAYLRVRQYTRITGKQVKKDFETLQQSTTINKMILDLRGNGGGSVNGTLALVDFLIAQDTPQSTNPILITDGSILKNKVDYLGDHSQTNAGAFSKSNFVVLIDGSSASASEITAAALKDYKAATLIGTTSFGKGISQNVLDLIDGSGLLITSHKLLSPFRNDWHLKGISPDFTVSTPPVSPTNDPQLQEAIKFLKTGRVTSGLSLPPISSARESSPKLDPWVQHIKSKKNEL